MTILSDQDIARRLFHGNLEVKPLENKQLQVQPASIDVRLGYEFEEFTQSNVSHFRLDDEDAADKYTETVIEREKYILHPGDFVLGTTVEYVNIPNDLIAHVEGRSSLGRLAVVVHATAGVVDPGYQGRITLELSNLGKAPVALIPDMRIAQLTFTELSSEAERPYGSENRNSKYQNQTGPEPTRISEDPEFQ